MWFVEWGIVLSCWIQIFSKSLFIQAIKLNSNRFTSSVFKRVFNNLYPFLYRVRNHFYRCQTSHLLNVKTLVRYLSFIISWINHKVWNTRQYLLVIQLIWVISILIQVIWMRISKDLFIRNECMNVRLNNPSTFSCFK